MTIGRGWGLPVWETGFMGVCPECDRVNTLIFQLQDAKGIYYHCMMCGAEFENARTIN